MWKVTKDVEKRDARLNLNWDNQQAVIDSIEYEYLQGNQFLIVRWRCCLYNVDVENLVRGRKKQFLFNQAELKMSTQKQEMV